MGWFTPYKKRANGFNYIPRYFDPQKEAREQRRAELTGRRLDDQEEYVPGKYIRTQREAREARRGKERQKERGDILKLVAVVVLVLFFAMVLYPRLLYLFSEAKQKSPVTVESYYGDFDPSAPISIVPNDYQEPESFND